MEHTRALAVDIGERVSGTKSEARAVEYIRSQLETSGYESTIEPFTFEGNRFGSAEVQLANGSVESRPLQGSEGGEVRGRLVFVGYGLEQDVAAVDLRGAIALADRGEILFRDKLDHVERAGATALIVVNRDDEFMPGATLGRSSSLPVVGVRSSAREALVAAASAGESVTVTADSPETTSVNVLAKPPGTEACLIVVGAHHDTVPGAPGANDNASGVGHILELARTFAANGLDEGLCFATFGGEESGLFGSQALVTELVSQNALPRVMVNFDVTGLGMPVEAIGDDELVADAIAAGLLVDVEVVRSSLPPNSSSDHASFEEAGVPVLFFTSGEFATIHSAQDGFAALSVESVEAVGLAGQASIAALYRELATP